MYAQNTLAPMGVRNVPRQCKNSRCGIIFYTSQNYIKRQGGRGNYCCRQCAVEPLLRFRSSIASGVDIITRNKAICVARNIPKQPCQHCGAAPDKVRIEKHHESYAENQFKKVIFLCQRCHNLLHFTVIPQVLEIKKKFFRV